MSENNVKHLITDQEIAFARLILSGTMTDRQAAEAVGLDPDTADYTKSKPCVCGYMLGHRAAIEQQLVEFNVSRGQVLTRLWEIANMEPERTRNSMSSQVKAISMIVAIEGLIPDRHSARRAVAPQNQPVPPPDHPPFYVSAWARKQQNGENADPEPSPAPKPEEPQQEATPISRPTPDPTPMELSSRPEGSGVEGPAVGSPLNPPQTTSSAPRVPMADHFAPDTRVPFSINKKRFGRPR